MCQHKHDTAFALLGVGVGVGGGVKTGAGVQGEEKAGRELQQAADR